ncbi:hypothetical protein HXX76_014034 [Chlamydomonas incerta]|uniref:Uncharacterized protein n=1 Tax=Chlamydomonas incerta TaxID=51695 RepID=A0A835SQC3_CHLIN|nr:hypothetical protein HXX76_014034 [Chlamydomonas incerta]|eukprot:KAG2424875.1 hypothetical protein HXX76_014034 [Chlamydomonas incerta]
MDVIRRGRLLGAVFSAIELVYMAVIGKGASRCAQNQKEYASHHMAAIFFNALCSATDPGRKDDVVFVAACEGTYDTPALKSFLKSICGTIQDAVAAFHASPRVRLTETMAGAAGGGQGPNNREPIAAAGHNNGEPIAAAGHNNGGPLASVFRRMMAWLCMAWGAEQTDLNAMLGTALPRAKTDAGSHVLARVIFRLVAPSKAPPPSKASKTAGKTAARRDAITVINSDDTAQQLVALVRAAAPHEWVEAVVSADYFNELTAYLHNSLAARPGHALVLGPVLLTTTTVHKHVLVPPAGIIMPLVVLLDAKNLPNHVYSAPRGSAAQQPAESSTISLFDLVVSVVQVSARTAQLALSAAASVMLERHVVEACRQEDTLLELAACSARAAKANPDDKTARALACDSAELLVEHLNQRLLNAAETGGPEEVAKCLDCVGEPVQSIAALQDSCATPLGRVRVSAKPPAPAAGSNTSTTVSPALGASGMCDMQPDAVEAALKMEPWHVNVAASVYFNRRNTSPLMGLKMVLAALHIAHVVSRAATRVGRRLGDGRETMRVPFLVIGKIGGGAAAASAHHHQDEDEEEDPSGGDDDASTTSEDVLDAPDNGDPADAPTAPAAANAAAADDIAKQLNEALESVPALDVHAFGSGDEAVPDLGSAQLLVRHCNSRDSVRAALLRFTEGAAAGAGPSTSTAPPPPPPPPVIFLMITPSAKVESLVGFIRSEFPELRKTRVHVLVSTKTAAPDEAMDPQIINLLMKQVVTTGNAAARAFLLEQCPFTALTNAIVATKALFAPTAGGSGGGGGAGDGAAAAGGNPGALFVQYASGAARPAKPMAPPSPASQRANLERWMRRHVFEVCGNRIASIVAPRKPFDLQQQRPVAGELGPVHHALGHALCAQRTVRERGSKRVRKAATFLNADNGGLVQIMAAAVLVSLEQAAAPAAADTTEQRAAIIFDALQRVKENDFLLLCCFARVLRGVAIAVHYVKPTESPLVIKLVHTLVNEERPIKTEHTVHLLWQALPVAAPRGGAQAWRLLQMGDAALPELAERLEQAAQALFETASDPRKNPGVQARQRAGAAAWCIGARTELLSRRGANVMSWHSDIPAADLGPRPAFNPETAPPPGAAERVQLDECTAMYELAAAMREEALAELQAATGALAQEQAQAQAQPEVPLLPAGGDEGQAEAARDGDGDNVPDEAADDDEEEEEGNGEERDASEVEEDIVVEEDEYMAMEAVGAARAGGYAGFAGARRAADLKQDEDEEMLEEGEAALPPRARFGHAAAAAGAVAQPGRRTGGDKGSAAAQHEKAKAGALVSPPKKRVPVPAADPEDDDDEVLEEGEEAPPARANSGGAVAAAQPGRRTGSDALSAGAKRTVAQPEKAKAGTPVTPKKSKDGGPASTGKRRIEAAASADADKRVRFDTTPAAGGAGGSSSSKMPRTAVQAQAPKKRTLKAFSDSEDEGDQLCPLAQGGFDPDGVLLGLPAIELGGGGGGGGGGANLAAEVGQVQQPQAQANAAVAAPHSIPGIPTVAPPPGLVPQPANPMAPGPVLPPPPASPVAPVAPQPANPMAPGPVLPPLPPPPASPPHLPQPTPQGLDALDALHNMTEDVDAQHVQALFP